MKQFMYNLLNLSDDVGNIEKALICSFAEQAAVDTDKSQ